MARTKQKTAAESKGSDEVSAFVDSLMKQLEALDTNSEVVERQREEVARAAGREMDQVRDQLDEARKTVSTPTGALLMTLGLGRPKRQGGKAMELYSAAVGVVDRPKRGVKGRRRRRLK